MTVEIARRSLMTYTKHKYSINTELDLPERYVFSVIPRGSKEKPYDAWYQVNKKTGKVSPFAPYEDRENFLKAIRG